MFGKPRVDDGQSAVRHNQLAPSNAMVVRQPRLSVPVNLARPDIASIASHCHGVPLRQPVQDQPDLAARLAR